MKCFLIIFINCGLSSNHIASTKDVPASDPSLLSINDVIIPRENIDIALTSIEFNVNEKPNMTALPDEESRDNGNITNINSLSKSKYQEVMLMNNGTESIAMKVFTNIQIVLTVLGLIANIITLITLTLNGKCFTQIIKILLQHQAVADSFVCIMGLGLLIQPFMWMTGNDIFDLLLCQAWHGQALYWGGVLLSVWNLVFIAVERFLMVIYPLKHQCIFPHHVYVTFVIMYIFSVILLGPAYLQVRYVKETHACHNEYYFRTDFFTQFMHGFAIFWFFIVYAIPMSSFIILYGKIVWSLRKRRNSPELGSSRIIDNANQQLTRTAIAVAIVFVISLSWDAWFYLLGFAGLVTYEFNTPPQIIGVFLSTFNSCANPFIYCASMPMFRKSLKETLSCSRPNTTPLSTQNLQGSRNSSNSHNGSVYSINVRL